MMETWNKGNKMIRKIGDREDPFDYLELMKERLRTSEALLDTYIKWFTHRNPHGCSICDLLLESQAVIDSFESFLGPREVVNGFQLKQTEEVQNLLKEGEEALNG